MQNQATTFAMKTAYGPLEDQNQVIILAIADNISMVAKSDRDIVMKTDTD